MIHNITNVKEISKKKQFTFCMTSMPMNVVDWRTKNAVTPVKVSGE